MKLRSLIQEDISHFGQSQNKHLMPDIEQDDIGWFYIVTKPTPNSTLQDICFGTTLAAFTQWARGSSDGIKGILGIFVDKNTAITFAKSKLQQAYDDSSDSIGQYKG